MRVAITGASGTGKTFLARAIAEKYGLPINPIGARTVAASMGFDNPYDVDRAGKRKEFQERLFTEKRAWEEEHEAFVTDRSYFDNLAYCALHLPTEMKDSAPIEYTGAMARYTHVLFCPASVFQQLDDGIRQPSRTYHHFYEVLLIGFFRQALYRNASATQFLMMDMPLAERQESAWALLGDPR